MPHAKSLRRRCKEFWWGITWRYRDPVTFGEALTVMLIIGTLLGVGCILHNMEILPCRP